MGNLATIQAELYDTLGYTSAPASEVVARLLRYLNLSQREIVGMRSLSRLRRKVLTFASVSGSPFAVLPQAAVKLIAIQDRTNMIPLTEMSLQDLRDADPGLQSSSGTPSRYVVLDLSSPVALDPSAAAQLFVISDSASDGASKTAFIEGIATGGYYRTASAVMNGVTSVSFGATLTDWIAVTKFYLALTAGGVTTAAGAVTLRQTSGVGTELSRIIPGHYGARYSRLHLFPKPSAVVTYYADVELHIEDMAQAGDEPYLPEDFQWLLGCGARMKEYQKREKPIQYGIEKAMWKEGLSNLKAWVRQQTGSPSNTPRGWSQLGSYYPAGT